MPQAPVYYLGPHVLLVQDHVLLGPHEAQAGLVTPQHVPKEIYQSYHLPFLIPTSAQ